MNSVGMTAKEAYELWQREGDNATESIKKLAKVYEKYEAYKQKRARYALSEYILILSGDPNILPNLRNDKFKQHIEVIGELPWERPDDAPIWTEEDEDSARYYIERVYGRRGVISAFKSALRMLYPSSLLSPYDSAVEFIDKVEWDGIPRAETLFIDALGVEDTTPIRFQTLNWLKAIVARQYEPGAHYDKTIILCGENGMGRHTLLNRLTNNKFFGSLKYKRTLTKRDYKLNKTNLIVEVSNLKTMSLDTFKSCKTFLKRSVDRYRGDGELENFEYKRRCVFVGVTDGDKPLDERMNYWALWILRCRKDYVKTHPSELLTSDYVDQIWAEVRYRYTEDSSLFPSDPIKNEIDRHRQSLFLK